MNPRTLNKNIAMYSTQSDSGSRDIDFFKSMSEMKIMRCEITPLFYEASAPGSISKNLSTYKKKAGEVAIFVHTK